MTAFRSQTNEQLAARWDPRPHEDIVTGWRTGNHNANGLSAFRFAPRVECIPSRDPLPWRDPGGFSHARYSAKTFRALDFDPRPEFARPPVNPILNALRFYMETESGQEMRFAHWAENLLLNLEPGMSMVTHADAWGHTPEHIEHARKVLTRLVALATEPAHDPEDDEYTPEQEASDDAARYERRFPE